MQIPSLPELLEAGAHFGHQANHWHPKMAPYIYGARGGVHIIDLEKTQERLKGALEVVKNLVAQGGVVLFVGTKPQAKSVVKSAALSCGMPFVTERWLGGTLTNFRQLRETINRYVKLREQQEKGELDEKYTKMERLLIAREIEEDQVKVGGIENMKKLPDAIFISDIRHDKTALMEAVGSHVKVIGVCDTNVNPEHVDEVIPMNDDAVRSIQMVYELLAEAVNEGKATAAQKEGKKEIKEQEV
ncbi:30S ribosomal protein S2 [Candidatus Uhrbacteria bacterium]|nr:30S ribosomal protein S2 [Candidatus Uhrbacteria bacterium]